MERDLVSTYVSNVPQSGIREIYHEALKLEGVIHLEIGDPDFSTPREIIEAIYEMLLKGITHYTHNAGLMELRKAIADYYEWKYGVAFNPENEVVVTVGGTEALVLSLLATVDPGDEVLVPDPGYPSYTPMILAARGRVSRYRLLEEKYFEIDPGDVLLKVTPRTKVIIINNPHNPTGSITPLNKLKEVVEYAHSKGVVVLADEVYENIVYDDSHFRSLAELGNYENVIIANSFSKTFAMTGLRVGFIASKNRKLVEIMTRLQEGVVACAPAPIQAAVAVALKKFHELVPPLVKEFKKRRDIMVYELKRVPRISFLTPKGAFYVFVNVNEYTDNSHAFAIELLRCKRVAVAPGIAFGPSGEGYIRTSFAVSIEKIVEGVERIRAFLAERCGSTGDPSSSVTNTGF